MAIKLIINESGELKDSLYFFGYMLGKKVCVDKLAVSTNITTPMNSTYAGININSKSENIVISTKDDYSYFAKGVAKAVIATGCTAITLVQKAYKKYMPKGIIIVSAFYCKRGLDEVSFELPNVDIYVGNEKDDIDDSGMLIPGVGNLDLRLNT